MAPESGLLFGNVGTEAKNLNPCYSATD